MLSKKFRLSRRDFLITKSQGKPISHPLFSAILFSNLYSYNRFSIVTSSKLHKSAVIRNRLRRQIYSCLQHLPGHSDIIVFPKRNILKLPKTELEQSVFSSITNAPPLD